MTATTTTATSYSCLVGVHPLTPRIGAEISGVDLASEVSDGVMGEIRAALLRHRVDLTYRCTLDRFDVVRVASLTPPARSQLRYALVRLDALRTPRLDFEVESLIGRRIEAATAPRRHPPHRSTTP
jgi:hypothetical protein